MEANRFDEAKESALTYLLISLSFCLLLRSILCVYGTTLSGVACVVSCVVCVVSRSQILAKYRDRQIC